MSLPAEHLNASDDPTIRGDFVRLLTPLCASQKESERHLAEKAMTLGLQALCGVFPENKGASPR